MAAGGRPRCPGARGEREAGRRGSQRPLRFTAGARRAVRPSEQDYRRAARHERAATQMTAVDPFDIRGRVALVTGASSGLGENFARRLAASGATVLAAARRADRLERLVADIVKSGGKAIAIPMDVTDRKSVVTALEKARALAGVPDIVVKKAGIAQAKASLELSEEDWRA